MKEYTRSKKSNNNDISIGKGINKKINKLFIIEQREYIDEDSFKYRYNKLIGWSEWIKMDSYVTEKQRDEAYDTLIKKVNNATGFMIKFYKHYEYRKKELE